MNYEVEIIKIKQELNNLQRAFLQSQANQVPITSKTDEAYNGVQNLTPYTETKIGYYDETEKTFYGVPGGNVTVFFDNYSGDYSVSRREDRLTISFDRLTAQTNITISIK